MSYEWGVRLPELNRMRLRKALSKSELARLAGISRSTVIRADNGETVSFINARKLAEALGVSVEELQGEDDPLEAVG